jgi:hypothetical protein
VPRKSGRLGGVAGSVVEYVSCRIDKTTPPADLQALDGTTMVSGISSVGRPCGG